MLVGDAGRGKAAPTSPAPAPAALSATAGDAAAAAAPGGALTPQGHDLLRSMVRQTTRHFEKSRPPPSIDEGAELLASPPGAGARRDSLGSPPGAGARRRAASLPPSAFNLSPERPELSPEAARPTSGDDL